MVISILFFVLIDYGSSTSSSAAAKKAAAAAAAKPKRPLPKLKTLDPNIMEAPVVVLDAPKDTPYTAAELKKYDGATPDEPIYVAMKGMIFDGAFVLLRAAPALAKLFLPQRDV